MSFFLKLYNKYSVKNLSGEYSAAFSYVGSRKNNLMSKTFVRVSQNYEGKD